MIRKSAITIVVVVVLFIAFFAQPFISPYIIVNQVELAKELDISIWDYPFTYSFPSDYFREALKPGMTIDEVHEIVKGYDLVSCCDLREINLITETYTYYAEKGNQRIVLEANYDGQGFFENLQGMEGNKNIDEACRSGLFTSYDK